MAKSAFNFKTNSLKKITSPLNRLSNLGKPLKMKPYTISKKPRGFGKYK